MLLLFNKLARQRKAEDGKKKETKTYVRLEASKYLTAPISLAHLTPISNPIGWKRRSFRRERVTGSSRRSSLVPIRRMGVVGAWCRISGIHWRVRERVLACEQRRGGREHGKDLLSIFQNVFFFFNNDLEMQRSKIDKAGKWSALDCSFERKAVPGTPDSSRIHESKTPLTYSFDIFETWWGDD